MYFRVIILLLLIQFACSAYAQVNIIGVVEDSVTGKPLSLTKIDFPLVAHVLFTDSKGNFKIDSLYPGTQKIIISKEGYFTKTISLEINENYKENKIYVKLSPFEIITDTIDIQDKYFKKTIEISTSHQNANYEEIRRAPGAAEDIIKYFEDAPGVSFGADVENAMIVRGGSPVENLTLVEGLELPNPNHFGPPGSTNGILSYINLKLVKDADFYTGGFPVRYGDRLSSVLDIKFREGNKEKRITDLNVSASGFGIFTEGPLNFRSSYMFSLRRSYLELLKSQLNSPFLPAFWDLNFKLNFDLGQNRKLSFIGFGVVDDAKPYEKNEFEEDTIHTKIFTTGITYLTGNKNLLSKLNIGFSWNNIDANYHNSIKMKFDEKNLSLNETADINYGNSKIELFGGLSYFFSDYLLQKHAYYNSGNLYTPAVNVNRGVNTVKLRAGLNISNTFFNEKLVINLGARTDYFGLLNNKFCLSPRLGITFKAAKNTNLNLNAGIFYQSPEFIWVIADESNRNLKFLRVNELVAGVEQFLNSEIRFTAETYLKQYYNYPVNVYNPYYSYVNSGIEIYSEDLDRAISYGKGYSFGVDFSVQKKNNNAGLFWQINTSFSRSRFYAILGGIRAGEYQPDKQVILITGYKFGFGLSLSSKIKYSDGTPYTPLINEDQSILGNGGDEDLTMLDKLQLPYYLRFDLRVDYQVKIHKNILTAYIDIVNVLNRKNYYGYYWSVTEDKVKPLYQLPRLPIIGISYKF